MNTNNTPKKELSSANVKGMPAGQPASQSEANRQTGDRLASPSCSALFSCPKWYVWKNTWWSWRFAILNPKQSQEAYKLGAKKLFKNLILIPHRRYQEAVYASPQSILLHFPKAHPKEFVKLGVDTNTPSGLAICFLLAIRNRLLSRPLAWKFCLQYGLGCACDFVTRPLSWVVDKVFQPNVKGMPADQNAPQSEAKDKAGHRLASPACSASDLAWTFELLDDNNEVATAFTISPKCKKLYAVGSVLQLLAEEAKKLGVSDSLARVRVRAHKFNEVV